VVLVIWMTVSLVLHHLGKDQHRARPFRREALFRADRSGSQRHHPDEDERHPASSQPLHRTHGFSSFIRAYAPESELRPSEAVGHGMRMKSAASRSANWLRLYARPTRQRCWRSAARRVAEFERRGPIKPPPTPVMRVWPATVPCSAALKIERFGLRGIDHERSAVEQAVHEAAGRETLLEFDCRPGTAPSLAEYAGSESPACTARR
jgi:hypothetical protein